MNEPSRNQPHPPHSEQPSVQQPNLQPRQQQPQPQPGRPQQGQQHSGYPYGQPQPGHPHPPLPPRPRTTSTRGPKILTLVGGGLLALGILAWVLLNTGILSLTPKGMVNAQGEPGSDVVLLIENLETGSLESPGDISYLVWKMFDSSDGDDIILGRSAVEVTGPDGGMVEVTRGTSLSSYSDNGLESRRFAGFHASEPGTYLITINPSAGADVDGLEVVLVTEIVNVQRFLGGAVGSLALLFGGIGGIIVGVALAIAGLIWWGTSNSRRKRSVAHPGPSQSCPRQPGPPPAAGQFRQ